jgi:hypothetical protein
MAILFGSILAAVLLSQFQSGTLQGKVIDDRGKPVADAQVIFYAPPPWEGTVDPFEIRTKTDAGGQFCLDCPPLGRPTMVGVHAWTFQRGSALAASRSYLTLDLVLRKPQPRTVKVQGPDGRPVAGVTLAPRVVQDWTSELPDSLAQRFAVTTGPDGQAVLDYLTGGDNLIAVRLTADSCGTQDVKVPTRDVRAAAITIRLEPTRNLAGHVRTSAGKPVAGQEVEVWCKGGRYWQQSTPVGFKNGPLRTAADGSFRTPDNLFVGWQYRMVIRAPGMEPILSKWITIGTEPRVLLPFIQRPLRTLSGRVLDRRGKPLAGIEVFQSGDGPERTATKSGHDGRFTLGGFLRGPVFLFARGQGFRFFGRLVKSREDDITAELTRRSEAPTRVMQRLPEPIPQEESQALVVRLIKPCWEAAVGREDPRAGFLAATFLAAADPVVSLRRLEGDEISDPSMRTSIRITAAIALARTDPARAVAEVEGIVGVPRLRVAALFRLAEALPAEERQRKLALLDRAVPLLEEANSQYVAAEVAERLYDLGQEERARAIIADSTRMAKEAPGSRGRYATRLARFDLPAALAIAKELAVSQPYTGARAYESIALGLAAENPAEAERLLRLAPRQAGRPWLPPVVVWKMAQADPARARRLVDETLRHDDHPQLLLFLALGLKARDPAAASQAFWQAIDGIDRLLKEGALYQAMRGCQGLVLPLVEQIDPALVPELFWRAVASRPPAGNPRTVVPETMINLAVLLKYYDRDVAATLFEPVRAEIEQTENVDLAAGGWQTQFEAWSLLDPRAAVARLEQLPIPKDLNTSARDVVATMLRLSAEERWLQIWSMNTEMRSMRGRDIP